ncbi:MAG: response regulator [Patescibacteria group bacterium]|nr:response regulator [Patescibacteria group bacterium]
MAISQTKKILLIEDDKPTVKIVKLMLEQEGYEVSVAGDGEKAIEALKNPADLILLDLLIPKIDGFQVLKIIRQEKKLKLPVVVFSNLSRQRDIEQAAELGANDYLVKSEFSAGKLKQKINNFFNAK